MASWNIAVFSWGMRLYCTQHSAAQYKPILENWNLNILAPWRSGTLYTSYKLDKEHGVHQRAATCAVASDHTSLYKRWDLTLPRVPRHWTSPPWWGELRCCHVSRGSESRFLVEVSFGAVTYPSAPELTSAPNLVSLLRWAPVLSNVPRLWALPFWEGSSDTVTCLIAPGGL
jgi:hypothetical protein